jgi:single-strand DNA-binding protein
MPSNQTPLTIVGNLTADPELRFTAAGVACCALTVAVNPRMYDKDKSEWKDGEPAFHRVTAWRTLGENAAESLRKGDRVIVTGALTQRHWDDDNGQSRSAWNLTADAVGPDLSYAQAKITKTSRVGRNETAPDDPWATASATRPPALDPEPAF